MVVALSVRSCFGHTFVLKQLMEKYRAKKKELWMVLYEYGVEEYMA